MTAPVHEPRSYRLTLGDKGRLVIPAEIRASHGWSTGSAVIAVDSPQGVLLVTLEEALSQIRAASPGGVEEFLAGRCADRALEDEELASWGASS